MKLYRAGYCNLRALLMYLVIYGHLIERRLGESPALQVQYRWIYAVHMPAFAFLSGLFCKQPESCRRQAGRALSVYLAAQLAAVALLDQTPWTPYWHLWYLLSLSMWGWSCWAWRRRWVLRWYFVLLAGLAGCLAGYLPFLGRGVLPGGNGLAATASLGLGRTGPGGSAAVAGGHPTAFSVPGRALRQALRRAAAAGLLWSGRLPGAVPPDCRAGPAPAHFLDGSGYPGRILISRTDDTPAAEAASSSAGFSGPVAATQRRGNVQPVYPHRPAEHMVNAAELTGAPPPPIRKDET